MTSDERNELLKESTTLAYAHLRYSGLYRELTEDEWERVAEQHGQQVVELLERLVDARFTELEMHRAHEKRCYPETCECGAIL